MFHLSLLFFFFNCSRVTKMKKHNHRKAWVDVVSPHKNINHHCTPTKTQNKCLDLVNWQCGEDLHHGVFSVNVETCILVVFLRHCTWENIFHFLDAWNFIHLEPIPSLMPSLKARLFALFWLLGTKKVQIWQHYSHFPSQLNCFTSLTLVHLWYKCFILTFVYIQHEAVEMNPLFLFSLNIWIKHVHHHRFSCAWKMKSTVS